MRTLGVVAALAALATACGGGGGDDPATTKVTTTVRASGTTGAAATTAPPTTAPPVAATVFTTTPAGAVAGPATLADTTPVTTAGLGTVLFGMPVAAAEKAAGTRLLPDPTFAAGAQCIVVKPEAGPAGLTFTVANGAVQRLDVRAPGKLRTRSGAGVGSSEATLKTLFAEKLVVTATAGARRAVYTPTDASNADFRVIFELDATGAVTAFRAGRVGVVDNTNPCA